MDLNREQKLIHAAQQGDQQAFAELYRAYVDKIYRYIFFRVGNAETADDLTSEVFLRVVESLPGYQDRNVPFLAWLYRVAHARVVDHYRREHPTEQIEEIEDRELSTEDDLDGELMTTYHQETIRTALRTLTDEQQQVIILRFVENYNLQQTAQVLGKTISAIKVMQHRAIKALNLALHNQNIASNEI